MQFNSTLRIGDKVRAGCPHSNSRRFSPQKHLRSGKQKGER